MNDSQRGLVAEVTMRALMARTHPEKQNLPPNQKVLRMIANALIQIFPFEKFNTWAGDDKGQGTLYWKWTNLRRDFGQKNKMSSQEYSTKNSSQVEGK